MLWFKKRKKKPAKNEPIRYSKCCNYKTYWYYSTGWTCAWCYGSCEIKPPKNKATT